MHNNPATHHRHTIRLKGYDYSQAGLYFVTICVQNRACLFGKIRRGDPCGRPCGRPKIILNEYGKIAQMVWEKLPQHYKNIELGEFIIMPNHFHAIVAITKNVPVGATLAVALNENAVSPNENAVSPNENAVSPNENAVFQNNGTRAGASPAPTMTNAVPIAPTLGKIVGAYKSLVANKCLEICKSRDEYMGKLWQRNYYEHIIRNEQSHQRIANYIINNPANWENDKFFPE